MKKIITIIMLILFAISCNIKDVNAEGEGIIDVGTAEEPPSPTPTGPGEGGGSGISCQNSERAVDRQSCGISALHSYRSTVHVDIYNSEGNYVANALKLSGVEFEAGRLVGIDAFESYQKTRTVTINPSCSKVTLTCKRILYYTETYTGCADCSYPTPVGYSSGIKWECSDGKEASRTCGGNPVYGGNYSVTADGGTCGNDLWVSSTCAACTPPSVESCYDEARSNLNSMSYDERNGSYNAKRQDSNDITKNNIYNVEAYVTTKDHSIVQNDYRTFSRTLETRVKYNTQKTCLNAKTGKARYIKFTEECDKNEELTVKNYMNSLNEPIGMYFIPLNAKTGTAFHYFLESGEIHSRELCEAFIEKYKDESDGRWRILLLDQEKKPFSLETTTGEGIARVQNGCYYAFTLNFNVKQKFYNEKDSNETPKINGYDAYYRPININNPFPNGISATSIWNGLIDTSDNTIKVTNKSNITKKYNLSDSYKEKTYSIYNIDSNAIREYNHEDRNFYTSWEGMNINGTSTFVNKYLTRYNSRDYYKLGCGPANSDWEECKQ